MTTEFTKDLVEILVKTEQEHLDYLYFEKQFYAEYRDMIPAFLAVEISKTEQKIKNFRKFLEQH